jgi:hypothetical protein
MPPVVKIYKTIFFVIDAIEIKLACWPFYKYFSRVKILLIWAGEYSKSVSMGLHHPLDGVTNPTYKLLPFIQLTKLFAKRRGH